MPEFRALVELAFEAEDMGEVEDRLDDMTEAFPLDVEVHGYTVDRLFNRDGE